MPLEGAALPFRVGAAVEALFVDDDQWYAATIDGADEDGVWVTFTDYDEQHLVDAVNIRGPAGVSAAAPAHATAPRVVPVQAGTEAEVSHDMRPAAAAPLMVRPPAQSGWGGCRFGLACTRADGHFDHPPGSRGRQWGGRGGGKGGRGSPRLPSEASPRGPAPCRFGKDCTRAGCWYSHPDRDTKGLISATMSVVAKSAITIGSGSRATAAATLAGPSAAAAKRKAEPAAQQVPTQRLRTVVRSPTPAKLQQPPTVQQQPFPKPGTKVQAQYEDGEWYAATVDGEPGEEEAGKVWITFTEYAEEALLAVTRVRRLPGIRVRFHIIGNARY